MRGRVRQVTGLLIGLSAFGLVACQPVPPPPPPTCGTNTASPTPSHPVDYVAVVDDPGASAPNVETFTAASEQQKRDEIEQLKTEGTVVSVEPDAPVSAVAVDPSNDPQYGSQYGLKGTPVNGGDFPNAWAANFDGTGTVIAVVDTGVQASHEDLTGKVLSGADLVDGATGDGRSDPNGHGTHVAGIAAATDNTVGGLGGAPGASILPVRVLDSSGSGFNSTVANGIFWAVDHGANVVNLSLGGCNASAAMSNAVSYATNHNVVLVAAAGNDGTHLTIYPAAYDAEGAIAVASTDSSGAKSSFSNFGSSVDIAAPGSSIVSTLNTGGYGTKSGTSMATPIVAAGAALIRQQCPGITPAQVLYVLQSSVVGVPGYVFGRLQAGAAIARNCV